MAFIPSAETHPISEAVSVSNDRVFEVIQIADSDGNIIDPASGTISLEGDITFPNEFIIGNTSANPVPVSGVVNTLTGLEIPDHDYIALGYTGSDLTSVTYKTGGSEGTIVATLTLAYSGGNLVSVTKS